MPVLSRNILCLAALILGTGGLVGCYRESPITVYHVPTEMPDQLRQDDRMLAAIVPTAENVWFFKLVGPNAATEPVAQELRRWVATVSFAGDRPTWTLPDHWQERPAGPMRTATIEIETPAQPLELSVSSLPRRGDWDEQIAMNINRWRQQMGLEESETQWAGAEPLEIDSPDVDAPAAWVELRGVFAGGPAGMPGGGMPGGGMSPLGGLAGSAPPATVPPVTPTDAPPTASAPSAENGPLQYDTPAGWRPGRSGAMRLAAFEVGPEQAPTPAEVTVIRAGGDARGNVARWLGQIRPDGVPEEVVNQALEEAREVTVDGQPGQRFVLQGSGEEPQWTDVTIVPTDEGQSLFIKMTGPAPVVAEEEEAMGQFLESLKLSGR